MSSAFELPVSSTYLKQLRAVTKAPQFFERTTEMLAFQLLQSSAKSGDKIDWGLIKFLEIPFLNHQTVLHESYCEIVSAQAGNFRRLIEDTVKTVGLFPLGQANAAFIQNHGSVLFDPALFFLVEQLSICIAARLVEGETSTLGAEVVDCSKREAKLAMKCFAEGVNLDGVTPAFRTGLAEHQRASGMQ